MTETLDTNALFLGPKAENADVFEKFILESFRDHIFWRRNFHPEDPLTITKSDKRSDCFENTLDVFHNKFYEMISQLKNSVPFYSPRYLGHMTSDLMMPAMVGYFASLLYNQNNVCYEASPVTSKFEIEVGRDLAAMMGFNPEKSWGHLTSGGTVANIEALWVIRNIKYFPLIAKDIIKKYNKTLLVKLANGKQTCISEITDDYTLLSLSPDSLSDLTNEFFEINWSIDIQSEVYKHERNISHSGMKNIPTAKVLVPSSKHYSWPKAAELLGIGRSNIIAVQVDDNFRMDINDLKQKLTELYEQETPVLAVVGIVGSTECGSVDPIDRIVEMREWYEKECNSSFYIHIDGAYGGYPRSIFLNEKNNFIDIEKIQEKFKGSQHVQWPMNDLYNAYKAICEADSVTIDPHKLGYIPYPAGAILYKDKRIKPATLCKAPYINNTTKAEDEDTYIGEYILEGSKPGAAAAACWLAHKVSPLNENGYGQIISAPIKDAHNIYDILMSLNNFKITKNGKDLTINVKILNMPELDILLYVFNIEGNSSLSQMNKLNELVLEEFSFNIHKALGAHDFFLSSTDFTYDIYGNSVNKALTELGINLKDWEQDIQLLKILRTSVVTPFINTKDVKDYYWKGFSEAIVKNLKKVIEDFNFKL